MVQLTGLSWEFDCLAKFEQELPEYEKELCVFTDLLSGASLDLEFASLEDVLGFQVGLIKNLKGPGKYDVALKARKTTFGLRRDHRRALYFPLEMPPVRFIDRMEEELDALSVCIGGTHKILNLIGRPTRDDRGTFGDADCENLQNFNLAYVPQHVAFEEASRREFKEPIQVRDTFLDLGYGEEMSNCLFGQAMEMFKDETRSVSLLKVQKRLFSN